MQHPSRLLPDGVDDFRDVVAGAGGEDAAEEVEVAVTLPVDNVPPFAAHELERLVVVQSEPPRHHRFMAKEQVAVHRGQST